MATTRNIFIGTSGWSYKHWKNVFYPESVKPAGYLSYLAESFNCTEINTSFYRLPKPETLRQWMKSVPDNFRFCPKMSRYLTQMKKLNDPEEPLHRFFSLFRKMKKYLGPVLIQLPPNLGFHAEKAEYLFNILKKKYAGYKFALEVRHESWIQPSVTRLLKQYGIIFVIADSGHRFPMAELVTAKDIYIRFHGPDGSYATSYSKRVLKKYADSCVRWRAKGHRIWIFFNNDVHGFAIENAKTLQQLLGLKKIAVR
jgi:uncharacterized protein YecE (DUF72 family)